MPNLTGADLDHISERQEMHISLTLGTSESVATVVKLLNELLKEPSSDLSLEVRELAKKIAVLTTKIDALIAKQS